VLLGGERVAAQQNVLYQVVVRSLSIAGTVVGVFMLLVIPVTLVIWGVVQLASQQQSQSSQELSYTSLFGNSSSNNKVLAVRVKGEIDSEPADASTADPTMAYGYNIAHQLEEAAGDDSVKAVVLVIDSPGGTVYGARAIADAVASYRSKTHRPVVAQVAGEADSGAYWVAASADTIWADYGTDVGSIGVISGPFRYYQNVTSLNDPQDGQVVAGNISSYNITAGAGKDEGDPYRQLTQAEKANIQAGVNNDYAAFVNFVSGRRHIDSAVIRDKIGAYSYDPTTALGLKLIDHIAGRVPTFDEAARRAGLASSDYEAVQATDDGSGDWASASPSPDGTTSAGAAAQCQIAQRWAIAPGRGCYNK
jgi:protease-4